jgi:hypothetical protein
MEIIMKKLLLLLAVSGSIMASGINMKYHVEIKGEHVPSIFEFKTGSSIARAFSHVNKITMNSHIYVPEKYTNGNPTNLHLNNTGLIGSALHSYQRNKNYTIYEALGKPFHNKEKTQDTWIELVEWKKGDPTKTVSHGFYYFDVVPQK